MPDQCEPGRMPIACVEKFEMGVRAMTEAADAIRTVGAKVDTVCVLLTGNGAPETGMVFRVKSLEIAAEDAGKARGKWKDRLWCLATGALLVALAWSLAGCAALSKPANASSTTTAITPEIHAESIEQLRQEFKTQISTVQTTNYALDAERRKLEESRHAREILDVQSRATQMLALIAGALMFALAAPGPKDRMGKAILFFVGIGLTVAAIAGPMLTGWIYALF